MIRRWIALFLLLCGKHVCGQSAIEVIPIDLVGNLIFIDVFVNDSEEPLHFLFDTGAGITVMDSTISRKIKLDVSDAIPIGTAGKTITSELSEQNQIRLGKKLLLDSISIAILNLSHLSSYLKTKVDGIIGNELLQKLVTETNIDAREMRFYDIKDFEYQRQGSAYKLTGLESGHLGIPFEIVARKKENPIGMILKIDTAADNYFTFHNETVNTHDLLQTNRRLKPKQGFGADATISNNLSGKIFSAEFGGKVFRNVPAVYEIDPLNSLSKRLADGLVGQAILLNFNITYHVGNGVAYFERRK